MRLAQTDPNRGRAGRARLSLEGLETRDCPSTLLMQGHTLLVQDLATNNDTVTIRDSGHGDVNVVMSDGHGHTRSLTAHSVQKIEVDTGSGNDTINYALTGPLTVSEQLVVNTNAGNDNIKFDFSRGVSAPNLYARVNTGTGDDSVSVLFGAIKNTSIDFRTNLGNGNDHMFARFNGDLTGMAKVYFQTLGGVGFDGLDIAARANIAAAASLQIDSSGGPLMDTFHVNYQGQLNGKLAINTTGGTSLSWIQSDITVLAGSTGSLQAHLTGHGAGDMMILHVNDLSHRLRLLDAVLSGGPSDSALATPNVKLIGGVTRG
jgi:hypothetical protein